MAMLSKRIMILFSVIALTITGCSFTGLVLKRGEWFTKFTLNRYFDLNSEQNEFVNQRLPSHWRWLLKDKLPQLEADLDFVKRMAARGVQSADAQFIRDRIVFWRSLLNDRLNSDAAQLLLTLDPEQVSHVKKRLEAWDEKWQEILEEEDEEKFRDRLLDYHIEGFESWYGSISSDQERQLEKIMPMDRNFASMRLRQLQSSRQEFLQMISPPKSLESISQGLRTALISPQNFRNKEYREEYQQITIDFWNNFAVRDGISTPAQRTYASERIQSFIDDLRRAIPKDK